MKEGGKGETLLPPFRRGVQGERGAASPPWWELGWQSRCNSPESLQREQGAETRLSHGLCRDVWGAAVPGVGEGEEAAGGWVSSTYPFQDNLFILEHPITAIHLERGRQRVTTLCCSWGNLFFLSGS